MDIKDAIINRRSVRSFTNKKIDINVVKDIIKIAHLAPSAGNLQARDFIIVEDQKLKEKLSIASLNQAFISEAPMSIVVCANLKRIESYGSRGKELYCIQDSAAAIEHILLLATSYELGTCWVGAFNEKEVSNILRLPSYIRPMAIIPIGYPNKNPAFTSRLDGKKLIHYNYW